MSNIKTIHGCDNSKNEFTKFITYHGIPGGTPSALSPEDILVLKTHQPQEAVVWFLRKNYRDPIFWLNAGLFIGQQNYERRIKFNSVMKRLVDAENLNSPADAEPEKTPISNSFVITEEERQRRRVERLMALKKRGWSIK